MHIPVYGECYVDGFPSVVWQSETGSKLVTKLLKTEWNISTFFSVRVFKNSWIVELTSALSFRWWMTSDHWRGVALFQKRGYRPRRSALFSRERLTINTTTSEKETNKRIIPLVHPHISPRQSRSKRASSLKIIGRKFSHSPPM